MDETFARVLVVGPTKSGKTSLLASLSHSQSQEYEPTIVATKFTDCARKLTFIDTPGIDDTVLHQGMRPDYSLRYESFENDSLVKELRGIPNSAAMNANTANNTNSQPVFNIFKEPALAALVESNLVNIHAVLIVYTGDSFSLRTAKALRYMYYQMAVEAQNPKGDNTQRRTPLKVFMLQNTGDIRRPDPPKLPEKEEESKQYKSADRNKSDYILNIFNDGVAIGKESTLGDSFNAHVVRLPDVDVIREWGITEALTRIQGTLGKTPVLPVSETLEAPTTTSTNDRGQCSGCWGV